VQCHLGGDAWQRLRQEVGRAHAGFDGAERMLDPLPTLTHLLWCFIEPALNRFCISSLSFVIFPVSRVIFVVRAATTAD
jgi:hypothetical protein